MIPSCPRCGSDDGFRAVLRGYASEVQCKNPECNFQIKPDIEDLIDAAVATYERVHAPRAARQTAALFARADALQAAAKARS